MRRSVRQRRRGAILIVTLIIVFVLAALVIAMAHRARSDLAVSANRVSAARAEVVERSAEQYVLALLSRAKEDTNFFVETLDSSYYRAVRVEGGYFWIVRPDYNDPLLPPWGLVDETTKLDLNIEDFSRLMQVPGMTEQIAANIIDWRDADDESTNGYGAESSTYAGRSPSYQAKNAPFETVEELLLVDGMTHELLYGPADQEPLGETSAFGSSVVFGVEHWQRRGFIDLFTVWNVVPATDPDGNPRVRTRGDTGQVRDVITEHIGGDRAREINNSLNNQPNIFLLAQQGGMTVDELRKVEPYLIGTGGQNSGSPEVPAGQPVRGRINLNYAPREVLLSADEDTTDNQIDAVINTRRAQSQLYPGSMAWLLESDALSIRQLDDDVTARGTHFSADIIAAGEDGRAFRRVRIVVDTAPSSPQIVYRRDLTDAGWPLDPQILADLRQRIPPR